MFFDINNDLTAVIPIGGKGTRLKKIIGDIPKPIFPILGKSTLYRACEILANQGIKNIFITIGYKSNKCKQHIELIKEELNINLITYEEKNQPLGESGALWQIRDQLTDDFLFINGYLIFSIDFSRIMDFHKRLKSELTLITHTSKHPFDSDLISAPNGIFIEDIFLKSEDRHSSVNAYLGFSAISIIKKKLLYQIDPPSNINCSSLFHHFVRKAFEKKYMIFSYNTSEFIRDMGTPTRIEEVKQEILKNSLEIKNYKNKQKALFVDRDNTIIECKKNQYILAETKLSYLKQNIKKLAKKAKDFSVVILVTNQPQISMGLLSIKELENINSSIIAFCLNYDFKIDVITYCPHHPHKGYDGEVSILKKDCFCRKPHPGLFLEQAFLRNIDLENSLMIGDSKIDEQAATQSGCNFCFIDDL